MEFIDAVLPLARTRSDWQRFLILQQSVRRFFGVLGTLWVVVPQADVREIASLIKDSRLVVLAETDLIPEWRLFSNFCGWQKQQLIKIAIASMVKSEFYLTLDADVICTRQVDISQLVREGRGHCCRGKVATHPDWYAGAARVLGMQSEYGWHNVTPAILSRNAMLDLQAYLGKRPLRWRSGPRPRKADVVLYGLHQLSRLRPFNRWLSYWRLYLLRSLPWTEYALYFTWLEATSQFDTYHFDAPSPLFSNCVWTKEEGDVWRPEDAFLQEVGFFTVVQSASGIDPDLVWQKIQRYLEKEDQPR